MLIRDGYLDRYANGLADAVRRCTSAPPDVVVFDPDRVRDRATFERPHQFADGIDLVLVNGVVAVERGRHTGERAGRVLRT